MESLSHEQFLKWAGDPTDLKLVVIGTRGCGKCMEAKNLIESLEIKPTTLTNWIELYVHEGNKEAGEVLQRHGVMGVPVVLFQPGGIFRWKEGFELQNWLEAMSQGDRSFFEEEDLENKWLDMLIGEKKIDPDFAKVVIN